MKFFPRRKKVNLEIDFNKETGDIQVTCEPATVRPTETIQILMLAIQAVNQVLQQELKSQEPERKPEKKKAYIS